MPASDLLDTQLALADIRTRVLAGERLDESEYHRVLNDLRRDRKSASRASAKARRDAAKAAPRETKGQVALEGLFKS